MSLFQLNCINILTKINNLRSQKYEKNTLRFSICPAIRRRWM